MEYGNISFKINHKPVEVSILVEGQHESGRFIANHDQRGIAITDTQHQIRLTADEALLLLSWLQNRSPNAPATCWTKRYRHLRRSISAR